MGPLLLLFAALAALAALAAPPPYPFASFSTSTPIGPATGFIVNGNVAQLTVKYASAQRFQPSILNPIWISGTAPPPVCPQMSFPGADVDGQEDCLYMNIFIPLNTNGLPNNLPILTWIHGGSFIFGSASNPGLNASQLAVATRSIVAVPQYRLGALGFLPPSSLNANSNLGAKDIVNALAFLKQISSSLGGNQDITIAGQSSGATLIRGLLAAPSAQSLFQRAWLHSDPMAYGFNLPSAQTNLQTALYSNISCDASDLACQQTAPLADILNAQLNVYFEANNIDPSASGGEPIRIVHDGQFITSTLTGSSFPSNLKPIVLTTVNMEAGPAVYQNVATPVPSAAWTGFLSSSFTSQQIDDINNSGFYTIPPDSNDIRPEIVKLGTDQIWRCPTWTLARTWARCGGTAYVGVFDVGNVYPDNVIFSFCTSTNVCHEGDIEVVFGTMPSPSSAQAAVIRETQARYSSFLRSSNPNVPGFTNWPKAVSENLSALQFGATGPAPVEACEVGFFGSQIPYAYQTFNQ